MNRYNRFEAAKILLRDGNDSETNEADRTDEILREIIEAL